MEKEKYMYIYIGNTISTILEFLLFYDYQLTVFEFFSSYNRCVTYFILHIRFYIRTFVLESTHFLLHSYTYICIYVHTLGMISIFIWKRSLNFFLLNLLVNNENIVIYVLRIHYVISHLLGWVLPWSSHDGFIHSRIEVCRLEMLGRRKRGLK